MAGATWHRLLGRSQSSSMAGFLLLLLLLVNGGLSVVRGEERLDRAGEAERDSCFETVSSWSAAQLHESSSLSPKSALDGVKLRDLLFFLHIPRTGGRTFHQCFLKHLLPSDQRCPRSYDKLRIDRSQPGCRLISTHDDYSLLDKLPFNNTSVVTSLREPVDRVLSSYEFSIEVAARSLRRQVKRVRAPKGKYSGRPTSLVMDTLSIWPWKYLVPTMQQDLFARQDARQAAKMNVTGLSADDSYNAALIAMPLEEFIEHPVAHELVHNGATFQVAGLTNTSYSANSRTIRRCVIAFPRLGKLVVDVAKKRLDSMLYVGLTEGQNASALFFARALEGQISMEDLMRSMLSSPGVFSRSIAEVRSGRTPRLQANFTSLDDFTKEEVMEEMLASYTGCVGDLRFTQEMRRSNSLEMVKPIKFSREMRKLIPDYVMQKIADLNLLDAELYAYAKVIFQRQQQFLQDGDFYFMKQVNTSGGDIDDTTKGLKDRFGFTYSREISQLLLGFTTFSVLMILMMVLVVIFVVTKRHGNRLKEF